MTDSSRFKKECGGYNNTLENILKTIYDLYVQKQKIDHEIESITITPSPLWLDRFDFQMIYVPMRKEVEELK